MMNCCRFVVVVLALSLRYCFDTQWRPSNLFCFDSSCSWSCRTEGRPLFHSDWEESSELPQFHHLLLDQEGQPWSSSNNQRSVVWSKIRIIRCVSILSLTGTWMSIFRTSSPSTTFQNAGSFDERHRTTAQREFLSLLFMFIVSMLLSTNLSFFDFHQIA